MKYIDADKLIAVIESRMGDCKLPDGTFPTTTNIVRYEELSCFRNFITSLQQEKDMGEVSDCYHTFNELYYYRMLYNAAFFNLLPKDWVHKSKRHHTGEECFGGGWFIVMANLPTGQISNHYELKNWDLFKVPEKEFADEWDGHTPQEAADRLCKYLQQEQPEIPNGKFVFPKYLYARTKDNKTIDMSYAPQDMAAVEYIRNDFVQQEQPEVELEKEIMKWQGCEAFPEGTNITPLPKAMNIVEKTARHFYELGLAARKGE